MVRWVSVSIAGAIFILVTGWFYSGWPQIWEKPPIPPEIQEATGQAVAPTVSTQDATERASATAKLHGTIEALNNGNGDLRGFDWKQAVSFKISAASAPHNDYGLGYPVTYKFSIPAAATDLSVWKKTALPDSWAKLTEKTSDDFFNGIEAVRFDYTNNFAYVSVAFDADSDDIYILFKDSAGDPLSDVTFVEISEYYDNRKAVVTVTDDDYGNGSAYETRSLDAFQGAYIWLTMGLITELWSPVPWSTYQSYINNGYVEVSAHSRTHPSVPYGDYPGEIEGSKQDIIGNLNLPSIYKKGATQYVPAWLEPHAQSDSAVRTQLGTSKFLVARNNLINDVFATWDATYGLYNRIGYSQRMGLDGVTNLTTLNNKFTSVYNAGGIYHLMFHHNQINPVDWEVGQYAHEHLDYIKEKKDVWYVGFGALYMYHYAQERGQVSVSAYGYTDSWTEGTSGVYAYGIGSFEHIISGLLADATYFFRAKAHSAGGWGYGEPELVAEYTDTDTTTPTRGKTCTGPKTFSDSLVINQGQEYTKTRETELSIKADSAANMSICNDSRFIGCSLEPFLGDAVTPQNKSWTLGEGDGVKTVYAVFVSGCGMNSSPISSDTIILQTPEEAVEVVVEEVPEEVHEEVPEEIVEKEIPEEVVEEVEKPITEMTIEELKAKIAEIMAQVEALRTQLTELEVEKLIEDCSITSFDRDLRGGMRGEDVKCLQIILNSDVDTRLRESGLGSPGNETTYFGPLTKAAVIKFQEKYQEDILTPWELTKGTGLVGSTTRAKINEILGR